jgi:hypothetical protein
VDRSWKQVAKVKVKLQKEQQIKDAAAARVVDRSLSQDDKAAARALRAKQKRSKIVKAKVKQDIHTCVRCGDVFPGKLQWTYLGAPYCSQYCHAQDSLGDDF